MTAHSRILEVLTPEKHVLSAGERSRWPNFTFFIFPGTVLPFYFSVVRGSTNPGKTRAYCAGPILPFFIFIFPGIVLPFFRGQYFHFSGDSTSILLFFRSTESPGKTRSVFTPPAFLRLSLSLSLNLRDPNFSP
jgi:hypothetical protein